MNKVFFMDIPTFRHINVIKHAYQNKSQAYFYILLLFLITLHRYIKNSDVNTTRGFTAYLILQNTTCLIRFLHKLLYNNYANQCKTR